jgi:hypothetical protein
VKVARNLFIHVPLARSRHGVGDPAQKAKYSLDRSSSRTTAMAGEAGDIFMYGQNTHGSLRHSDIVERSSIISSLVRDVDRTGLS